MSPDELIGSAFGLIALALAARLARRRAERSAPPASRLGRVSAAALVFASLHFMAYAAYAVSRPGGAAQLASNFIFMLPFFVGGSLLLFGLVEWGLGAFRPERSRNWLVAALAVFILAGVGVTAGPVWLVAGEVTLRSSLLLPITSSAAAAWIWWTFLPAPEPRPDLLG